MFRNLRKPFQNARYLRTSTKQSPAAAKPEATPPPATATPKPEAETENKAWKFVKTYYRPAIYFMGFYYVGSKMLRKGEGEDDFLEKALNPKSVMKLKVERLDDKISEYDAAFADASKGPKAGLSKRMKYKSLKLLDAELGALTDQQIEQLVEIGQKARIANAQYNENVAAARLAINLSIAQATMHPTAPDPDNTGKVVLSENKDEIQAQNILFNALQAKIKNEMLLMKSIEYVLSREQRSRLLIASTPSIISTLSNNLLKLDLVPDKFGFLLNKIDKMSLLPTDKPPRVFVLNFKGDIMATQVEKLREEITGILSFSDVSRGDSVVVTLHSGGGSVTGYGLAAAQLSRIRAAGLPLTVCVDEVAASGGYMMASVADKIIASPFALLGSVGVISTMPNFSNRLNREGIEVEDITAGKYKRTMTPYKKPTNEDRAKMKSDIEDVFLLFKSHLKEARPSLDVDSIATGEVWYGPDALKKGLCDELATSDDYIAACRKSGKEVYSVAMKNEKLPGGLGSLFGGGDGSADASEYGNIPQLEGESLLVYYLRKYVTTVALSYFSNVMQQSGIRSVGNGMIAAAGVNGTDGEVPVNQRVMVLDERVGTVGGGGSKGMPRI